jgi:hypothetical protein
VVGALLVVNQARLVDADPLNAPVLTELRRQYAMTPADEALKARIRQEDVRARQGYFAGQARAETGARLLLLGLLALLASLASLSLFKEQTPDVAGLGPAPAEWDRRRAARRGLAVGAGLLLAAAALAAVLAEGEKSTRNLDPNRNLNPNPNPNLNLNLNLNPNPPGTVKKQVCDFDFDYDYDYDHDHDYDLTLQFCHAPLRRRNLERGAR